MSEPRPPAEIAQSYLDDLEARYTDAGRQLLVGVGSDDWFRAQGLGLLFGLLESQSAKLEPNILPDEADEATLGRDATVYNVLRLPATASTLLVRITGTPSATVTFGTSVLVAPVTGVQYTPVDSSGNPLASQALNGSGNADVRFKSTTTGAATVAAQNTVLTWSSTPVNANSTAVVLTPEAEGEDQEDVEAWRARIILRLQERPASGNRADWQDWALAVTGVGDAFVYPLLHATLGANVLGSVTVVAMKPAQGDVANASRILGAPALATIAAYIEGTQDVDGNVVAGTQLRPVTMAAADYFIEPNTETTTDVSLQVTNTAAYPYPWTGTLTITSSTATTFVVAGDRTDLLNKSLLIPMDAGVYRGRFFQASSSNVVFAAGNTTFTFAVGALPGTPTNGGTVFPGPPNFQQARTAILTYFDTLGPGDTSPASRWPTEDQAGRATVYRAAISAAILNGIPAPTPGSPELVERTPGVINVVVATPGADLTPAAKQVYVLGKFEMHA